MSHHGSRPAAPPQHGSGRTPAESDEYESIGIADPDSGLDSGWTPTPPTRLSPAHRATPARIDTLKSIARKEQSSG
jgi:hypothetical protein